MLRKARSALRSGQKKERFLVNQPKTALCQKAKIALNLSIHGCEELLVAAGVLHVL